MSTPEGKIVADILEYLRVSGIFAWRSNSGAFRANGRMVQYGKVGSSDIIGILNDGRFLAIECKTDYGKVSQAQIDFLSAIDKSGGVAFVAHGVEDVKARLLHEAEIPYSKPK